MSRSVKKLPISGNTASQSDAFGKMLASKSVRRANSVLGGLLRASLQSGEDVDPVFLAPRELMSPYDFPKDGKQYVTYTSQSRRCVRAMAEIKRLFNLFEDGGYNALALPSRRKNLLHILGLLGFSTEESFTIERIENTTDEEIMTAIITIFSREAIAK